mmetsp:Transcript_24672/g.35405  ORF Transcript_24672/g.35405 Transcript_24672/m.35405 type:complete len:537 (+) Transcript_24672:91-1701(+)
MKLDPTIIRTMNKSDFRVLAAVEQGMKNHALVPVALVTSIANLRHGGAHKIMSSLLRDKLLSHDCSCGYDGYRLTNAGYDILALYHLKQLKVISALGNRIGTGKESDVYIAATPQGKQIVLKFHRLGRTSFRNVKQKRDYFNYNNTHHHSNNNKEQPNSWLFLSRVSALKEYAFMKALHGVGYPTPTPIGHNRHIVCMSLIRGVPLYQVHANRVSISQAQSILEQSVDLATRLAKHGLVHCDLNEFNLMVDLSGTQHMAIGGSGTSTSNQQQEDADNPYVRHSGLPVPIQGALSAHLPQHDATGEIITELPPEPHEFLEGSGEPKPIVTLIDFPQMVSTNHPNAKELYERDMACLQRFFSGKLKVNPEEPWGELLPPFEDVYYKHTDSNDSTATCCLANKAQIRLDKDLQASGYSVQDSCRDMELYYLERNHHVSNEETYTVESEEEVEEAPIILEESSDVVGQFSEEDEEVAEDSSAEEDKDASLVADATEQAKMRLRRYMEDEKRRKKKQGAFRTRNTNKTYVKGKKTMKDSIW